MKPKCSGHTECDSESGKEDIVKKLLSKKRAQGMTEYIIIVGLIAILLIAAVKTFRGQVGSAFQKGGEAINQEVTSQIPG